MSTIAVRALALLSAGVAAMSGIPVQAQTTDPSDVVIMRRVLTKAKRETSTPAPGVAHWRTGEWMKAPQATCGSVDTRDVACVVDGAVVEDARCTAEKPKAERPAEGVKGCYYNWIAGPWSDPDPACGESKQYRTMTCESSQGEKVSDVFCTTPKGALQQRSRDYSQCSYEWSAGWWGDWDTMCSPTATREREVLCQRSDGSVVEEGEGKCEASERPDSVETASVMSGCEYTWRPKTQWQWTPACGEVEQTRELECVNVKTGRDADVSMCSPIGRPDTSQIVVKTDGCGPASWVASEWSTTAPSCAKVQHNRTVECQDASGNVVDASRCEGRAPDSEQEVFDLRACSYEWAIGDWTDWSSTCSSRSKRVRTVQCMRSDGSQEGDPLKCGPLETRPHGEEETPNYTGCSYTWDTGLWGEIPEACGVTVQTRSVICERGDLAVVEDNMCDAATRPESSRPVENYTACDYSWQVGEWGPYNSGCADRATRTRTVECQRSDGTPATNALCGENGPAASETTGNYSQCSYYWKLTGLGTPVPACGATTAPGVYSCTRSDDTTVDDKFCTTPKPIEGQPTKDYTACSYDWVTTEWGDWSSTCSAAANRFRTATCMRSDKTPAPDEQCEQPRPGTMETAEILANCEYQWVAGEWESDQPSCGNVPQTRKVTCQRSDKATVADSFCPAAEKPSTTQTGLDTSACTYSWVPEEWGNWTSTCSTNATRTREVVCRRADGEEAADSLCTGVKPNVRDNETAVLTSCTYEWVPISYGNWSDTCSTTATRSITYGCQRSDGTGVADSQCTTPKPSPVSPPTNVTEGCEQMANGGFDNDFAGWYGMAYVSIADTGNGNKAAKMATTTSSPGVLAKDVNVVRGKRYNFHVEWTSASASGQCSRSGAAPAAIWKFPNGGSSANGNFVFDTTQICGSNKYVKDYSFIADYTGRAQIVLWLEPTSSSQRLTAYIDNVSFQQAP